MTATTAMGHLSHLNSGTRGHLWSKALGSYRDSHPQRCRFRQTYFEDNPKDLQLLRHDLPLHPAVVKPHLGHVPDYLGEWARGGSSVSQQQQAVC